MNIISSAFVERFNKQERNEWWNLKKKNLRMKKSHAIQTFEKQIIVVN